ncbi:MAG: flagellar protein, partial [Campylobacterota bacterium]|nr:flagellar protein [Campylobacterota bacterium]
KGEEDLFKWILFFLLLSTNFLFALEISINGAQEKHQKFSTLHIQDKEKFVCQAIKDEFEITTKIVCAFSKRPTKSIQALQNDFFKVDTLIKRGTFFLIITPFHKIKLMPVLFDLVKDETIYQADVDIANHWMMIGYEDKLPLINNRAKPEIAINFPYYSEKSKLPYVGGLDIKGNPVYIKKVDDVTDYLKIKKSFKEAKYEYALELIDEILEAYPNTLFKAELIYHKIKVYDKLKIYENLLDISKVYLREYSSDENIPEVLALTANAYSKMGQNTDADYFFDRLFSEHENSIYTQWGYVYLGEMLEASGGTSKAVKFYKKALNETENIDIATTAAYNLAQLKITTSLKDSAQYIEKIIKVKPSHFANNIKISTEMMYTFSDGSKYDTASLIAKAILDEMNRDDDEYEMLMQQRALWLAKTENKTEALSALNEYINIYPDGTFIDEIEVAKDELFFDTSDLNKSVKLAEYDKLISEYPNDTIGDRAIYEKAKLLLQNSMFSDVLYSENQLLNLDEEIYSDVDNIIFDAAVGVMKNSLENRECQEVLNISNEYNITLSSKWDDGIYECSMMGGDYQLAKRVASKNLKSKELDERKKWLYRHIKIDFAIGNYSDVVDASKDLISLAEAVETSEYQDVYRYLFDTYHRLEKSEDMITAIVDVQKVFGLNYKDLDRYAAVMAIGSDRKDDNIVIKYGEEVMKIQKSSSSNPQSPFVEFTLYQSYTNREDYNSALDIIKSLNAVELRKSDRARQKYLLGTVYSKLWRDEEAVQAYQESIDADSTSAWAKLAEDAKEI